MVSIRRLILVAAAAVSAHSQVVERTGSVAGRVTYTDGTPVAGATLGYVRLAPINMSAPAKRGAKTAADGRFTLTGMAAGSYQICVQGPASAAWLDPCVWSAEVRAIHLIPGQALTGQQVVVEKAATLEVRVADPTGALGTNEGRGGVPVLAPGVWTPKKVFLRALRTTGAGAVRQYELAVPQGRAFRIGVLTTPFQLRGDGGAAIQNGAIRESHTVPPGAARSTVNVTVASLGAR